MHFILSVSTRSRSNPNKIKRHVVVEKTYDALAVWNIAKVGIYGVDHAIVKFLLQAFWLQDR